MSEPNRIPMNWCGVWDKEGDYIQGDCVHCSGDTYVAVVPLPSRGVEPPGPFGSSWMKL